MDAELMLAVTKSFDGNGKTLNKHFTYDSKHRPVCETICSTYQPKEFSYRGRQEIELDRTLLIE